MKNLLILRHAKSDWNSSAETDFDRPLNKRGMKDAPVMGEVLREWEIVPQMILSSPAVRAKTTAELVAETCNCIGGMNLISDFYGSTPATILKYVNEIPIEIETAMVVGHNPTMEDFLSLICGNGKLNVKFPTCGLAHVVFDADSWDRVQYGSGQLNWFLIPKLVHAVKAEQ